MGIPEFDSHTLDRLAEQLADILSSKRGTRSNWDRRLTGIVAAISIVSLVLTLSFNLGTTQSRIEENTKAHEQDARDIQSLRELTERYHQEGNASVLSIERKFSDIQSQLSVIQGMLSATPRRARTPTDIPAFSDAK